MATGPRYKVPFRRRREGRTNYHLRLKLLLSRQDRVVVSSELAKYGYTGATGNTPAAYLTGLLFGLKSLKNGYGGGILDIGLQASSVGSRVYAALKGIVDSGFDIPCSSEVFPSEERIRGKHIAEYREQSSDLPEQFEATKEKIFAEFS